MNRKELIADLMGITEDEAADLIFSCSSFDPEERVLVARDVHNEEDTKDLFEITSVERCEDWEVEDDKEIESFTYLVFEEDRFGEEE